MTISIRTVDIGQLSPEERADIVDRSPLPDPDVKRVATDIVTAIRTGGNVALLEASRRYGGGTANGRLHIEPAELSRALSMLDPDVRDALEKATDNIRACHKIQLPIDSSLEVNPGVIISRLWSPLIRVGVYVPGGAAAYPSSLLMSVIPAQIAGVSEIAVATPADKNGNVSSTLLAAAELLEINEVYAVGGAQAIAAFAYGTETISPVEKIVGPGNAWVTAAKMTVYGDVAIDLPAGPSETLIIADDQANPRYVAADLLCEAEHGPDSPAILVTTSSEQAAAVLVAIEGLLPTLERETILRRSLSDVGLIARAKTIDEAITFANEYAPEHIGVQTADASSVAQQLVGAGSVFVGPWAPHSAGDYATGANHILPTGGLARSHGPLAVDDFGSWRQVQEISKEGLASLRSTITTIAKTEGLTAHRLAAEVRFEQEIA